MKIIVFAFLLLFCQFSNSTEPQQYTLKEYFSTTLEDVKKSQVLLKQLPTTPHSQDQQMTCTEYFIYFTILFYEIIKKNDSIKITAVTPN